jgi:hypothetical protein
MYTPQLIAVHCSAPLPLPNSSITCPLVILILPTFLSSLFLVGEVRKLCLPVFVYCEQLTLCTATCSIRADSFAKTLTLV